jgi:hypothetical protein
VSIARSITICAYNRPEYLRAVLASLLNSLNTCPAYSKPHIVIGIDPGGSRADQVRSVATSFISAVHPVLKPELIGWPEHLGVAEHPRRMLQHAYAERQSEFNLHLEDDTVLSPDALNLAEWFRSDRYKDPQLPIPGQCLCLSLFSRSTDLGTCPATVRFRPDFGAWGWCAPHISWWLWFSHYWNMKRERPIGFDWSASLMMHRYELWALEPALSRVRNIGREAGEHQSPADYDRDTAGLVCADQSQITEAAQFELDPVKPARPKWVHGL